jgi:hypothetical protein
MPDLGDKITSNQDLPIPGNVGISLAHSIRLALFASGFVAAGCADCLNAMNQSASHAMMLNPFYNTPTPV